MCICFFGVCVCIYTHILVVVFNHQVMSDSATPRTVTRQAPLSMACPRQEYWSWVAISFSKGSSQPRMDSVSPALADSLPLSHLESPHIYKHTHACICIKIDILFQVFILGFVIPHFLNVFKSLESRLFNLFCSAS